MSDHDGGAGQSPRMNDIFRDWIEIDQAILSLGTAIGILKPNSTAGWLTFTVNPLGGALVDMIMILVKNGILETNFRIDPQGGWDLPEDEEDYAFRRARSNMYEGIDLVSFAPPLPSAVSDDN